MVESSRVRVARCRYVRLSGPAAPTISGFVADPSGAGVPNARVALVNQDTAIVVITTKSDSNGNFAFPSAPASATYSISVQIGCFTR